MGLAAILLAGLFITIVTCIYLIPVEIERRTIYTVLSKPVQRFVPWSHLSAAFAGWNSAGSWPFICR